MTAKLLLAEQQEAATAPSPWFAGLRSRIAGNMSEWLSQLGIGGKREAAAAVGRAASEPPGATAAAPHDDADEHASWQLPHVWLNLEAGRNVKDTLELQHFGPLSDLVPLVAGQGEGHRFVHTQLDNPTWCDKCGDFIWAFYKQAVVCKNCNYTCHYKCRTLVTLDCRSPNSSLKSNSTDSTFLTAKSEIVGKGSLFGNSLLDGTWDANKECSIAWSTYPSLVSNDLIDFRSVNNTIPSDAESLRSFLHDFNRQSDSLEVTMHEDGATYSGYLQIHMNFTRPVNVIAGQRPPSVYDIVGDGVNTRASLFGSTRRTITSFFLPRDTAKMVRLTSDTTARQLIVLLLRKFHVADNPRKFALYERRLDDADAAVRSTTLTRVADDVCPLRLVLGRGADPDRQLVLQENDTGDILWDFFEEPELRNFLRVLEMEEQQYAWKIRQRFDLYRFYLDAQLRERRQSAARPSAPQFAHADWPLDAETSWVADV